MAGPLSKVPSRFFLKSRVRRTFRSAHISLRSLPRELPSPPGMAGRVESTRPTRSRRGRVVLNTL
jgi:hypothetical protein